MEADIFTTPIVKPEYGTAARLNISISWEHEVKWSQVKRAAMPCSPPQHDEVLRDVFEYCCGEESLMGQPTQHSKGCNVVRLTEARDMTTESGLQLACNKADESMAKGHDILLWSSMPCTGGSPWQNVNKKHASARLKIRNQIKVFNKLGDTLLVL